MSEPTDDDLIRAMEDVFIRTNSMRLTFAAVAPLLRRRVLLEEAKRAHDLGLETRSKNLIARALATPEPVAPTCDGRGLIRNGDGHRGAEYCAGCPRCAPKGTL